MSGFFSRVASPTGLFYIFVTLSQVGRGVYLAGQLEAPESFTWLSPCAFLWVLGWWLLMDSRKRGAGLVYDMGLFLYIAWPLFMPYYLLKTRGAKGLLVVLVFGSAYVAAVLVGMALYLLMAPESVWPEYLKF